jgi:hypothetical protein
MNKDRKLKNSIAKNQFNFQAFGVKIGITAEKQIHLKEVIKHLKRIFPGGLDNIDWTEVEYLFAIESSKERGFRLYRNEEIVINYVHSEETFFDMVESQIRITIAEFAVSKVFLHAGVVGWKNRAIVIPGPKRFRSEWF